MGSAQGEQVKEHVQAELLDIFMDLHSHESRDRERARAQRRLEARRAIEQYRERKELEAQLRDGWEEEL